MFVPESLWPLASSNEGELHERQVSCKSNSWNPKAGIEELAVIVLGALPTVLDVQVLYLKIMMLLFGGFSASKYKRNACLVCSCIALYKF